MAKTRMLIERWLAISETGGVRIAVRYPALARDEVAMHLKIEVPLALFTQPILRAVLTIPDEAAVPLTIDAGVVGGYEEAIRRATGLDVTVIVDTPPQPGPLQIAALEPGDRSIPGVIDVTQE